MAARALALGQGETGARAGGDSLRPLAAWIGEWRGSGWTSITGKREEFDITETVRGAVGGAVLVAEGRGTRRADGEVTHDGLAIVFVDRRTGRLHWQGHEIGRDVIDADVRLIDGGLEWRLSTGGATARFTIRLDGRTWRESGEMSADGTSWTTFMEMALQRVDGRSPPPPTRPPSTPTR